jgi:S1-C subfamily serine protease/TPR repeat protein
LDENPRQRRADQLAAALLLMNVAVDALGQWAGPRLMQPRLGATALVLLVDVWLASALVAGMAPRPVWIRARALVGTSLLVTVTFPAGEWLETARAVLMGAALLALIPLPSWPGLRSLAGAVCLGLLAVMGLCGYELETGDHVSATFVLRWRGRIGPTPVSDVHGRRIQYALSLPPGQWYPGVDGLPPGASDFIQLAPGHEDPAPPVEVPAAEKASDASLTPLDRAMRYVLKTQAGIEDSAWFAEPRSGARLMVSASHVAGAGQAGVAELRKNLAALAPKTGLEIVESVELSGPFDAAALLHLRRMQGDRKIEAYMGFFTWGDVLVFAQAAAPQSAFARVGPALREAIAHLSFQPAPTPQLTPAVAESVKASTVLVLTPTGSGSGFVVARRAGAAVIVTNAHVVADPGPRRVAPQGQECSVVLPSDAGADAHAARLIGFDAEADLAALEVPDAPTSLAGLSVRAASKRPAGSPVFVVGYPFGMRMGVYGLYPSPTVNAGRFAETVLPDGLRSFVAPVDVGINPGNSGGPAVDGAGAVVGVAVAHVPGSETSFIIPIEAIQRFVRTLSPPVALALTQAPEPVEPPPPPALTRALRLKAEEAMVLVSNGRESGVGVAVEGPGDQLLVVTRYRLVHDDDDNRVAPLSVVFHPGTPRQVTKVAGVLRSVAIDDLTILGLPRFAEAPSRLPLGDALALPETAPVELLGFRLTSEGQLPGLEHTQLVWRSARVSAHSDTQPDGTTVLHVDAGVNHGLSGGPVVNGMGALVGFAVSTEQDSNLTVAMSAAHVRRAMHGAIRGGFIRSVADGLGHCFLRFDVELDDPLHALDTVGLALQSVDGPGESLVGENAVSFGVEAAETRPAGQGWVTLKAQVRQCPWGALGYQLWTETDGARRYETPHSVKLTYTPDRPDVTPIEPGPFAGDIEPHAIDLATRPFDEPNDWGASCRALDACATACRQGRAASCYALGIRIYKERLDDGERALELACGGGITGGCEALAELRRDVHHDFKGAYELFSRACDAGNGMACRNKGRMLELGDLGTVDLAEVAVQLQRGCELHSASACNALGVAYDNGRGVKVDAVRAADAFRRACDGWDALACRNYAMLSQAGRGVVVNQPRAARLLAKACELGDAESCYRNGELQREGRGTPKSEPGALLSFRQACKKNNAQGCSALRELLAERGAGLDASAARPSTGVP